MGLTRDEAARLYLRDGKPSWESAAIVCWGQSEQHNRAASSSAISDAARLLRRAHQAVKLLFPRLAPSDYTEEYEQPIEHSISLRKD
jgi:hypothetical protein